MASKESVDNKSLSYRTRSVGSGKTEIQRKLDLTER